MSLCLAFFIQFYTLLWKEVKFCLFSAFLKHSVAPKNLFVAEYMEQFFYDIAFWVLNLWEVTAFAMKKDVYQNFSLA